MQNEKMNKPAAETAGYQRIRYLFCCHSRLSGIFLEEGCWTSQHDEEGYLQVKNSKNLILRGGGKCRR